MNALRFAFCTGAAIAILAGCGGGSGTPLSASPTGPSTALRMTTAERMRVRPTYNVLYSFKGGSGDGAYPWLGLLTDVKGTIYSTTTGGRATECDGRGRGTVFSITTSGTETVLHSFANEPDGARPLAGLISVNGTLYGTTETGGAKHRGTVFSITTAGTETVLHSFGGNSDDGATPLAALLNVNGTLYGTTFYEGTNKRGTVFKVTTAGTETVLYSFKSSGDGKNPQAGLININGTLYGTTEAGGANRKGTVFSITTSGTETVLYSFKGSTYHDGSYPLAALLNVNGTLYGTTEGGGANDKGTVFAITRSGAETVLHSFGGSGDGEFPDAALITVNDKLYGTTAQGGASGHGAVFAITTPGAETVLHSFKGTPDGAHPYSGLLNVKGKLYGTTRYDGAYDCGTVFALTP
ncbi:MAG TPA: choice-of-anchor tandem repeat GloVer-containing protein [Candidatus Cybelea sp.]|nr:choice-of-anchor tandem repeat GloVer-containing protein [Candidatus Cybelea sp.]